MLAEAKIGQSPWVAAQISPVSIGLRAEKLELLYLPAFNYAETGGKPPSKVWIQYSDQNSPIRVPVKTVHFPINGVLHLSSKFYLNPLTLVKYSKVQ